MKKVLLLTVLLASIVSFKSSAQKKYGYTVLYFRCGDADAERDSIYYSPVIELNTLNFPPHTEGMDPAIAPYSVRYYNYALAK
ncbi:MAG: hypothetical protein ABIQ31_14960 [Ferruginibacter sp.]